MNRMNFLNKPTSKTKGIKIVFILAFATILLFTVGCGEGTNSPGESTQGGTAPTNDQEEWEDGKGDLPSSSNNSSSTPDDAVTDEPIGSIDNLPDEFWVDTEYEAPTGEWFMRNGEGVFGYGLTTGTQKAGDEFEVSLFGHNDDGDELNKDVKIQLTERDRSTLEKLNLVFEEIIHVDTVKDHEIIFTDDLPEDENVTYFLSVEILDEEGEVEDTRVASIYVPSQEIHAELSTDMEIYETSAGGELELILENYGPTNLFFGTYYTIEKKVEGSWKVVPLDRAFEDIGIILDVGETYEQKVDIVELTEGEYRIVKDIHADGLDLKETLAAEFTVE